MLRRAKLLYEASRATLPDDRDAGIPQQPVDVRATGKGLKRKLSLKGSPLMRLAAEQVGRGASAGTFGEMARAACSESGAANVSSGGWAMHVVCDISYIPVECICTHTRHTLCCKAGRGQEQA